MPTYDDSEEGLRAGAPVELLRFAIAGGAQWHYTSSDVPVTYAGQIYEPRWIRRDDRRMSRNSEDNALRLAVPTGLPVIESFKYLPPWQRVYVSYLRKHQGAADADVRGYFQGFIGGVKFTQEGCDLVVNSLSSLMERSSPRQRWQPGCRFHLYDGEVNGGQGCPVPRAPYRVTALVASHTGAQLTSPALALKPNGWFQFGFVQLSNGFRTMILTHQNDAVTVLAPFVTSVQGLTVDFYAGCDQSWETCKSTKFAVYTIQGRSYGGHPRVPRDNPFSQGVR